MKTSRIKIALFLGGISSEHEVSLSSGLNILNILDHNKYAVKVVKIEKTGQWRTHNGFLEDIPETLDSTWLDDLFVEGEQGTAGVILEKLQKDEVEKAVILPMHGQFGEDGRLQALLEVYNIPFTGSGVLASALAMDKVRSSQLFLYHGLKIPLTRYFNRGDEYDYIVDMVRNDLAFPCVLKPSEGGSSVATFIVKDEEGLQEKIKAAFDAAPTIIFQEYIKGDEVTCGVLDTEGEISALPPTQIIPKTGDFFDYNAKYATAASDEITPAPQPPDTIKEIQEAAVLAHAVLGCRGLSRTDMIIQKGEVYVLETNTLPGMTKTSLFPQGTAAAGISFAELLDRLMQSAGDL